MDSVSTSVLCGLLIIFCIREHLQKKKALAELTNFKKVKAQEMVARGKLSELRTMAAGIAHEISNPLMIISGNIQRLQRHPGDDISEPLRKIAGSSDRIAKIIQGLRTYTHREEHEDVFLSLREMVDEVLLFCGQRMKNHGVTLKILNLEGLYVKGHRGQLEQAFLCLLNHAFDAVDDQKEKWIEINAEKIRDRIFINFSHSGPRLPHDLWSKMSEPFSTFNNGKPGLSIVNTIAESNNGKLQYLTDEIHPTFRMELPRAPLVGIKPTHISSEKLISSRSH
ncbi:MAG: histidine kinase dimerization/phospho-acceptor domain-containing protein [Bdellovibrionota bacterium]